MENKKIVLLAGKGLSTNIVFHALNNRFGIHSAIIEAKESKILFVKRRIKKLGFFHVSGQLMFQFLIVPVLNFISRNKISQFVKDQDLKDSEIPVNKILQVQSVNDPSVEAALVALKPDVIIVNGTRIISKRILNAVKCPIINTHAGITPLYRGVHGAYWALVNNDKQHCGVTVHLIDAGIDTGDIIYQSLILVNKTDNFVTYPIKQLAIGIPILIKAIEDALNGDIKTNKSFEKSGLWYHPTIWQYIFHLIINKVK